MHIAVDFTVWRVRTFGFLAIAVAAIGVLASVLTASAGGVLLSVALGAAGIFLAGSENHLIVRRIRGVHDLMTRTIQLLSLPFSPDPVTLAIGIPMVVDIRMRPIGIATLVTLERAGYSEERESYICRTLIKYQRTIQTIL